MKKTCIIYNHGFNSGLGEKYQTLKKEFTDIPVYAMQYSFQPYIACYESSKFLEELIEEGYNDIHIVGSSLGGYLSINSYKDNLELILNSNVKVSFYLINPSFNPCINLLKNINYPYYNKYTDESYCITSLDYKKFTKVYSYNLKYCTHLPETFIWLSENDEVINHKNVTYPIIKEYEKYGTQFHIKTEDQPHKFSDITDIIKTLRLNIN